MHQHTDEAAERELQGRSGLARLAAKSSVACESLEGSRDHESTRDHVVLRASTSMPCLLRAFAFLLSRSRAAAPQSATQKAGACDHQKAAPESGVGQSHGTPITADDTVHASTDASLERVELTGGPLHIREPSVEPGRTRSKRNV